MKNLVLITSIIDTPIIKLSYTNIRSVFSKQQRFEQTKKTIQSVREMIPNCKLILVECSILSPEELNYFENNCEYFLNLYEQNEIKERIYSISKSMCESTQIIYALKYMIQENIEFDNLFKISGRYFLNSQFNYSLFDNSNIVVKKINHDNNNILTALYKISKSHILKYLNFLIDSEEDMKECKGLEIIFAKFIHQMDNLQLLDHNIGVEGNVSVCGTKVYC